MRFVHRRSLSLTLVLAIMLTLVAACGAGTATTPTTDNGSGASPAATSVASAGVTASPAASTATEATSPAASTATEAASPAEETKTAPSEPAEASTSASLEAASGKCNIQPLSSPTTINLIGWLSGNQAFVADGAKECSAVPNLTLNAQILDNTSAGEQARLGLSTSSEGKPSPYEIIHASVGRFTEYAGAGWLHPIDDLIEKYRTQYNLDDIPQAFWDAASFEGKHYGVPFMGNAQIFYYRTDLLEKHNIKAPATWDEVIAACKVLKQEPDLDAQFTMTLNAGWAWGLNYIGMYESPGNLLLNEDNTPAFTGAEGLTALNKMLEVINTCTGEAGLTYSTDDSEIGMETGRVAMALMYATRGSYMDDPEKSSFVGKIGFAPAPATVSGGKYSSTADFDFLLMPKHSAVDHDLVFQVILNATDRETLEKGASGALVTRQSVPSTLRFAPATLEAMANAVPDADGNPAWNMASTALGNWLPKAATGLSPQEVLDGAAAEYTQAAKAAGHIK